MYQDWMENTPIFGKIKDVYIKPASKFNNKKRGLIMYQDWMENVPLEIEGREK